MIELNIYFADTLIKFTLDSQLDKNFQISNIITEEYLKLRDDFSNLAKLSIISNIIQIKRENSFLISHTNSLYKDIKLYIKLSIEITDSADYLYDELKIEFFLEVIEGLKEREQIEILRYYLRKLEQSSFYDEKKILQKKYYEIDVLKSLKTIYNPKDFIKVILYSPLINSYFFSSSFALLIIIAILIPLNAPITFFAWFNFEVSYSEYSNSFFLNHILNIVTSLIGINSEFYIVGKNTFSQVSLILGKVFFLVFISSVLVNKLNDYFYLKK